MAATISFSVALLVALLVHFLVVPAQRKKILGQTDGQPVKFTFGDSDGETQIFEILLKVLITPVSADSSANSSPKRTKRPLSLVYETKTLPAITESTELQSLNNQPIATPNLNGNAKTYDYYRVAQWNGTVPVPALDGKPHKFDPKLIKKAENLLGGMKPNNVMLTTSLDNTDLTITSLNYIDEYQNTINGRNLQNLYVKSPESEKK
jgi:sodium-dependent phosphate transporter